MRRSRLPIAVLFVRLPFGFKQVAECAGGSSWASKTPPLLPTGHLDVGPGFEVLSNGYRRL